MKFKLNKKHSKPVKALLFLTVLTVSFFSGYFGYVIANPSPYTIIEAGSLTSIEAYELWRDGVTYYAKNGLTGQVQFYSTNASKIIQDVLDAIGEVEEGCRKIVDGHGDEYVLSKSIYVQSRIQFQNFKLKLISDIWAIKGNVSECHFTTFYNIHIYSDSQRTGGGGFRFHETYIWEILIDRCYTENMYWGVSINPASEYGADSDAEAIRITNSAFWKSNREAIYIGGRVSGVWLENIAIWCNSTHQSDRGIRIRESGGVHLQTVNIMQSGRALVIDPNDGESMKHLFANDVSLDSGEYNGLIITGGGYIEHLHFEDLYISNNDASGISIYNAPYLEGLTFIDYDIQSQNHSAVYITSGRKVSFLGGYIGANCLEDTGVTTQMQGMYIANVDDLIICNTIFNSTFVNVDGNEEYHIYHLGGGTNIAIHDNIFVSADNGTCYFANYNIITARDNIGFVTENWGISEASHNDYIAHGLAGTPTVIGLCVEETDSRYTIQIQDKNSTHFQLYFWDDIGGELEVIDKTIHWSARY